MKSVITVHAASKFQRHCPRWFVAIEAPTHPVSSSGNMRFILHIMMVLPLAALHAEDTSAASPVIGSLPTYRFCNDSGLISL